MENGNGETAWHEAGECPAHGPTIAMIKFSQLARGGSPQGVPAAIEFEVATGKTDHPVAQLAMMVMTKMEGVLKDDPRSSDLEVGACATEDIPEIGGDGMPSGPASVKFDRDSDSTDHLPTMKGSDGRSSEELKAALDGMPDNAKAEASVRMLALLAELVKLFNSYGLANVIAAIGRLMVEQAKQHTDEEWGKGFQKCYALYGEALMEISGKVT